MNFLLHSADPPKPLVTPAPQAPQTVVPNRGTVPSVHPTAVEPMVVHWTLMQWGAYTALVVAALVFTIVAVVTLSRMLHAWRSTAAIDDTVDHPDSLARSTFTVLVPARHEGALLTRTLELLVAQSHPGFEVIVIVGDDDPATELIARQVAASHRDLVEVVIDDGPVKSRPRALNRGLRAARGDIIGVVNVGDRVSPELIATVDSRFSETAADIVQAGVQLMDFRSSWWSVRAALENYFWFRSGLEARKRSRAVPLSDSSAFIRRNWLEWAAGWDVDCLAEDAELGIRLTAAGATVAIAYSPLNVTARETPRGVGTMFHQHTRADLGSLQIAGLDAARSVPKAKRSRFGRYQILAPFFTAVAAVLTPLVIILAFLLGAPTVVVVITFVPVAVAVIRICAEVAGLSDFATTFGSRARLRDDIRLVLGAFPYQVVLAAASLNSVITSFEKDYSLGGSPRPPFESDTEPFAPTHVAASR